MTDASAMRDVALAVHAMLADDNGIKTQLGDPPRLYDDVPANPQYPYLTYGAARMRDVSADGAKITEHVLTLHIWSRYQGRLEALDALSFVTGALETGDLDVTGREVVRVQTLYADVLRTTSHITLHGIIRVRIITELETI